MKAREKAVTVLKALPIAHRVVIVVAGVILVFATRMFLGWLSTPSYTVLTAGLDDKELAEVINELETIGVDYKIEAGGSRVVVPRQDLATTKAKLAEAGVGGGIDAPGYELLDKQGLSVSDAMQQANFRRALEGELQKALGQIDGINSATVHLVVPETTLFVEDQNLTTAAVLLDTSSTLSESKVEAVMYLVSQSVEGLSTDNITINDTAGRVLMAPGGGAGGLGSSSDNIEMTRQFESLLAADVQRLLGPFVEAEVVVKADMNFDTTHVESEIYDPLTTVSTFVLRTEGRVEVSGTGVTVPNGIVGVDGGQVTTTTIAGETTTSGGLEYALDENTTEFGVSREVSTIDQAPGKVEALHVAIVLDSGVNTGVAPADVADVEAIVAAALGIDISEDAQADPTREARPDTIEVRLFDFPAVDEAAEAAEAEAAAGPAAAGSSPIKLVPQVLGGLVLLLVGFSMWRMTKKPKVKKAKKKDDDDEEEVLALGPGARPLVLGVGGIMVPRALESGEVDLEMAELDMANQKMESLRDDVIDLVQREPEAIAVLLRSWLADRRVEAR